MYIVDHGSISDLNRQMQVVANLLHILDLIHCTSNIRGNVLTSSRWLLKGALASLELLVDHLST